MKLKTNTLSVVIPTYNCLHLIKRHLAHLQNWIHLADEVIVVDSRSQDGTIDYIKKMIQHPRCLYIERDRGLYESWNEAIAATSGDWIYISTAGDIIDKNHLLRLMNAGITSGADVVVSPQRFVSEDGTPYQGTDYKNADFYSAVVPQTYFVASSYVIGLFQHDTERTEIQRGHSVTVQK